MSSVNSDLLRRDVRMLGDILGEVITQQAGKPALELVENVRQIARSRRSGDADSDQQLAAQIERLSENEARTVSRAFSIFLDLANIAEDRHRVRVLRWREQDRHPAPLSESIADAIQKLHRAGLTAQQVQAALDRLNIELVFTAHPSEAKRRSIRGKLRRMRAHLQELDRTDLLPREREAVELQLRTELTVLWQTEFLRPWRPTVLQEVERGLSVVPRLWEAVILVYEAMRKALAASYPDHNFEIPVFLRFGSWMGGDRDGNPNVTAQVTAETLARLRSAAVDRHLEHCQRALDFVTSAQEVNTDEALQQRLATAAERRPEVAKLLDQVAPREVYRRFVTMMRWRLEQSRIAGPAGQSRPGGYRDGRELEDDLRAMCDSLRHHHGELIEREIQRWLDVARVFGLHLNRLDIRQESGRYCEVMTEIFAALGLADDFAALPEADRQALLTRTMPWKQPIPEATLSPLAQETLALFRLLRTTAARLGPTAIGGHVISLTHRCSDVLTVLWLWRWALAEPLPATEGATSDATPADLRIIPLFEKIDDLKKSPQILEAILSHPLYAEQLASQGNRQTIMVGYSDSTKDGGYLSACWGLYRAQSQLQAVANKYGVRLTFFHGRGGSLGRGGGPAARGILSLPPDALDGTLRLTEQGEVLAERYDDVQIAYRHLEQVTWATLLASTLPSPEAPPAWREIMDRLAHRSLAAYRELVDLPGFIEFFSAATPIDEIEQLPIGSRPARRRGERTLNDLRAIPWVFSWTQNRCIIPAWYGLGTAMLELRDQDPPAWKTLQSMWREWPFLQATIDNASLALSKADLYVAARYAELLEDAAKREQFWTRIAGEWQRSRTAVLELTGRSELLSETPWLQSSIEVRNPYIDPLNLIQIELLRRRRALDSSSQEDQQEELRNLLRLTVQGIASGMRTTG